MLLKWQKIVVATLLALHAVLLGWIGWRTTPTRTEVGHMAAGLYSWRTGCFDVFCVNPPLVRGLATVPVLFCSPKCSWSLYSSAPGSRCEWPLGYAFIRANSPADVRWCFALARWACLPFLRVWRLYVLSSG